MQKAQTDVWMFVSGWKWESKTEDGLLPSLGVLRIVSVCETKIGCGDKLRK